MSVNKGGMTVFFAQRSLCSELSLTLSPASAPFHNFFFLFCLCPPPPPSSLAGLAGILRPFFSLPDPVPSYFLSSLPSFINSEHIKRKGEIA
jgi:hypothetical protein